MPRHHELNVHKSLPTITEDTTPRPRRGEVDQRLLVDESGNTALHHLAKSGEVAMAEVLLSQQTNVSHHVSPVHVRNNNGSTPLHVAAYYGKEDMVGLLVEGGAKVFQKNQAGWHSGHYANRWSQPLNKRLTVGCKPGNPSTSSNRFCFKSVRDLNGPANTKEKRISNLKSDSGISIWNSKEYLQTWNSKECLKPLEF